MQPSFNLNHIVTFVAVAEAASFRGAAEQLNISQSVISARIKALEDRLGVPLFHRTTRWVSLTHEGERLLLVAKGILADLQRVATELKEEATLQRGVVAVGAMPTTAAALLPEAIARFRARHPNITIKLIDVDSQRILDLMQFGAIDLGIVADIDPLKNVEFTPLFWDECFYVVGRSHPLSDRAEIGLRETLDYPLLLSPNGSRFRELVEESYARHELSPVPAQEAWHMQTLAALVEQGIGGAVMPRTALMRIDAGRFSVLKVRERIGRTVGVARIATRSESPATSAFRAFLIADLPKLVGHN